MRTLLFITLLLCSLVKLNAQKSTFGKVRLTKVEEKNQKNTPVSILYANLKPTSGTTFRKIHTTTDANNYTHITYQQYYNNIKVEFGIIKVHQQNGRTVSYNGAYFPIQNLATTAFLPKHQIETTAKQFLQSNAVFWFSDSQLATNIIPEPEKIILPNRQSETLHLALSVNAGTSSPQLQMGTLYIDATSGEVLRYKNRLFQCFEEDYKHTMHPASAQHTESILYADGTAATIYSGTQTFQTELDNSEYILEDHSRATGTNWNLSTQSLGYKTGIFTIDIRNNTNLQGTLYEFTDADNVWTAAEMSSNEDQYALDAHWGTQLVYDYWSNVHGRSSYEGTNASILSIIHYGSNYNNAAWAAISDDIGYMIYGDGSGTYTPFTSVDVVSHEIGHGVTNSTANLDYELESGALNESLSDIWAMVIENYANTTNGLSKDFSLINEENSGGAIRSISNPNTYGQPDTYGGTFWTDVSSCTPSSTNDYCGVHTNSGVLNYWFWLLSQGGSGTNDLGDSFTVSAIGMDDAAAIVWQMQKNYLTATSDYNDARTAAIQAAIDLYGECSTQEQEVTNAFFAVGVGDAFSKWTASVTNNPDDARICETNATSFSASGTYFRGLQWQVNDGNGWTDLSDDSTYSDTDQLTMNISNAPFSINGYQYRMAFQSDCGETYSDAATLTVMEYPDATVTLQDAVCDTDTGEITFSFPDNDARTNIEFSIDGGSTYPYNYDDSAGSGTVTNLASGTYHLFMRWGNDECFVDMGMYTINNLCYTAIPDANFEAALDALGYDNISGDGQVPTDNIETLTSLDVSNKNISDLTGIEDFMNLQVLNVSDNSITTIDVSNQTDLVTLNIARNSITSLDVSNNTQLSQLYGASNSITEVDLSNNPNLTIVGLNPNELTSLNIQNGNNTAITTFAINGNPNLTCVLVDDAAYSTSNWTTIDTQTYFNEVICYNEYTAIPDTNFEAALEALGYDDISGDGQVPTALIDVVTSLNVNSSSISDLTGIEDFVVLEALYARNNSLSSVDISALVNLKTIWILQNNLSAIDLSANILLEDIRIEDNNLTSIDVSMLLNLQILQIDDNQLTSIDVSNNTLLERLRVSNNNIRNLDISSLTSLTQLRAANNNMISLNAKNGNNIYIGEFKIDGNNLYCVLVDDAAYSTTNWTTVDAEVTFNDTSCEYVVVDIDVLLQGAMLNPNTGEEMLMRDDLRVGSLLDSISPYADFMSVSETIIRSDNENDSMVDWIWVELRDKNDATTIIAEQSAILQRDGDVVATSTDLTTPLTFDNVSADDYYIVVKHRNHLGIMSANTVALNQSSTTVDFTDATNEITYGSNAQTTFGMPTDTVAMWCGNVNGDDIIQYSGTDPDTPDILSEVLNDFGNFLNFPTYAMSQYNTNDIDMDGTIQYSGTDPDTPFILQNILAHPSNFLNFSTYQIAEQLPEND